MFLEQRKDGPHAFGFFHVYYQPPTCWIYVIAQHRTPAHPFPPSAAPPTSCREYARRSVPARIELKTAS
jgi:hypothetical protein